jgi:hypothetical protein
MKTVYRSVILAKYHIDFASHGFALFNALALGKIKLVAKDFHLGERFDDAPLIYPVLLKSALFTVMLIPFVGFGELCDWPASRGMRTLRSRRPLTLETISLLARAALADDKTNKHPVRRKAIFGSTTCPAGKRLQGQVDTLESSTTAV